MLAANLKITLKGGFMSSPTITGQDSPQKVEQTIKAEMLKHLDYFEKELQKVRTGRAHSSLVEDLPVRCYDSTMRIRDIATVTAPEAQLIVIQPWDSNNIDSIEKAITQSELNIAPTNDGAMIRLQLPPLSAARREELAKNIAKRLEECKVAIRNVRKDINNAIRDLEKSKSISEDIAKRLQTVLQKVTDEMTGKADALFEKKEKEIKTL